MSMAEVSGCMVIRPQPLFAAPAKISRRRPSFSFLAGLMWMQ